MQFPTNSLNIYVGTWEDNWEQILPDHQEDNSLHLWISYNIQKLQEITKQENRQAMKLLA